MILILVKFFRFGFQISSSRSWHTLDLYNNESLDKLVRRCAERFALGTTYQATAFATLINLLEAYRLEQLKKQAVEKETTGRSNSRTL